MEESCHTQEVRWEEERERARTGTGDGMATGRTCPHGNDERLNVSGTRLREMFANHEVVPPEFSRPEVLEVLQSYYDTVD